MHNDICPLHVIHSIGIANELWWAIVSVELIGLCWESVVVGVWLLVVNYYCDYGVAQQDDKGPYSVNNMFHIWYTVQHGVLIL